MYLEMRDGLTFVRPLDAGEIFIGEVASGNLPAFEDAHNVAAVGRGRRVLEDGNTLVGSVGNFPGLHAIQGDTKIGGNLIAFKTAAPENIVGFAFVAQVGADGCTGGDLVVHDAGLFVFGSGQARDASVGKATHVEEAQLRAKVGQDT